jgi:hypothetical protein
MTSTRGRLSRSFGSSSSLVLTFRTVNRCQSSSRMAHETTGLTKQGKSGAGGASPHFTRCVTGRAIPIDSATAKASKLLCATTYEAGSGPITRVNDEMVR